MFLYAVVLLKVWSVGEKFSKFYHLTSRSMSMFLYAVVLLKVWSVGEKFSKFYHLTSRSMSMFLYAVVLLKVWSVGKKFSKFYHGELASLISINYHECDLPIFYSHCVIPSRKNYMKNSQPLQQNVNILVFLVNIHICRT